MSDVIDILKMVSSGDADSKALSAAKLHYSDHPCVVNDFFEIIPSELIKELSNNFANAYRAVKIGQEGDGEEFYALCFKNTMPARINEIIHQCEGTIPRYLGPIEYGITSLGEDEEEFFAVVLPMPKGKRLSEIIRNKVKLDKKFVINNIAHTIANVIGHFHQQGYAHGNISPDNIFITNNQEILVGECISSPCGFKQPVLYETVERGQCLKISKSGKQTEIDYYALGILIYHLMTGYGFENLKAMEIIRSKLALGTPGMLVQKFAVDGEIGDLIRGLTCDGHKERWGKMQIDEMVAGRGVTMKAYVDPAIFPRALVFNGKDIYSRRLLAHELTINWDLGKDFIESERFRKWLESCTQGEKPIEIIDMLASMNTGRSSGPKLMSSSDEKLIKTIIALDPDGPFRCRNVSFFKEGIGQLLAYAVNFGQNEISQIVANSIYLNTFSTYEVIARIMTDASYQSYNHVLAEASKIIKKSEIGYGIERCLFDLNPSLPCQSPALNKQFCIGVEDVLVALENSGADFESIFGKRTISSFIASKLGLMVDLKIPRYDDYPNIQKSRALQILQLLAMAQKQFKIGKLPNLCQVIKNALVDLFDAYLNSSDIKRQIFSNLDVVAENGDFTQMLSVISNSDFYERDQKGYENAVKRSIEITKELYSYQGMQMQEKEVRRLGLQYAVKFSYFALAISAIMVLLK